MNAKVSTAAGRRGFSLLEVLVATAIFSLIVLLVGMTFSSTGNMVAIEATRNELERSGQRVLEVMAAELRDSAPVRATLLNGGSGIRFEVPVDLDGDGTLLDAAGELEFGFLQGGAPQQGVIIYRFVQNVRGGVPDVLDEAAMNMRLNNDADMTDRFARGYLIRSTQVLPGGPEVVSGTALTNPFIAQPDGNWGGDLTGNGMPDPIFSYVDAAGNVVAGPTSRIRINLWFLDVGSGKFRHFVQTQTCVGLRNR